AGVADAALSLREAITAVNSGSLAGLSAAEAAQVSGSLGSNDAIQFSVTGTITLQSLLPFLTAAVTIQGPGASALSLSGNDQFEVFIVDGVTALDGLSITHGKSDWGGIVNYGTLTVSNSTFSGNAISGNNYFGGGGISNCGTLTVRNSTF